MSYRIDGQILAPARTTERDMLDLLNLRYGLEYRNGSSVTVRWSRAEHVRNRAGFDAGRIADYVAMDLWPGIPHGSKLALHGHEVKVSRSDWLAELKDPGKAEAFAPFMDYWWLVVSDPTIVRDGELPAGWGLMVKAGGRLRVKVSAPLIPALPMPKTLLASLLRATAKTATRLAATT